MNKKLYIETYGCQMNVGDSEVIFSILAKEGYGRTEDISEADVILANTCSVRDNAEQRIWGRLEQFHKQKENRPQVVVGIVLGKGNARNEANILFRAMMRYPCDTKQGSAVFFCAFFVKV